MSPLPSTKDIERAVLDSTNELIATFQAAPYTFLLESDLQAVLLAKLRTRITGELQVPSTAANAPPYRLALVYSEYQRRNRIDIACLAPQEVPDTQRRPHKRFDTFIYGLPVHVGIELKYRKMGDKFDFSACERDLRKLNKLRSTVHLPFVLAFVQDSDYLEPFLSRVPSHRRMASIQRISEFGPAYVVAPTTIVSVLPGAPAPG